ncbi:MAG: TIGR03915 family putative DNA repair protein [Pyrinomonadaceae bacterium]|nr:TIGR03915 family putative DNA repair protein [Pyrinomonadaceae bacterium]
MIQVLIENSYKSWRETARKLLQAEVLPNDIVWVNDAQNGLFENFKFESKAKQIFKVPFEFPSLAETVACVDDAEKWSLLYRILWRLTNENRHLLEIESDDDIRKARLYEKAIARDVHKFHAFVRFRKVEFEGIERFIAWHEPSHFVVERATPFFVRRFGTMRFSILTPKNCAHWDLENLIFTEPITKENAPKSDALEDFWRTYYASTFNPNRLRVKAMKKEMPMKHWRNLPEAELISGLIRDAKKQ